jgi:UDP-glucuronate 4-epimerase
MTIAPPSAGCVLVTGAAGFIGSHVVAALLARGQRVVAIDCFDPFYDRAAKERNLREALAHAPDRAPDRAPDHAPDHATAIECDITDRPALRRVFLQHRPTGVIHLAGKAGVRPSLDNPAAYMHANVTGTAQVLSLASEAGCTRVALASSSSVYGNACAPPFREDADVSFPISPYAASKRACELLAHSHHHATRLAIACLRFFTVIGPRQRPDLAASLFIRNIARGEPIRMFGSGATARDYTFVDDIVAGVLSAYDRAPTFGYRVWNLGNSTPIDLRTMIATVERVVGKAAIIRNEPMQTGDVEHTCADISRARAELAYNPATPFGEGIARQWAWWKAHASHG